jgi:hypothetical protein
VKVKALLDHHAVLYTWTRVKAPPEMLRVNSRTIVSFDIVLDHAERNISEEALGDGYASVHTFLHC